jgi:hypothetical protein
MIRWNGQPAKNSHISIASHRNMLPHEGMARGQTAKGTHISTAHNASARRLANSAFHHPIMQENKKAGTSAVHTFVPSQSFCLASAELPKVFRSLSKKRNGNQFISHHKREQMNEFHKGVSTSRRCEGRHLRNSVSEKFERDSPGWLPRDFTFEKHLRVLPRSRTHPPTGSKRRVDTEKRRLPCSQHWLNTSSNSGHFFILCDPRVSRPKNRLGPHGPFMESGCVKPPYTCRQPGKVSANSPRLLPILEIWTGFPWKFCA